MKLVSIILAAGKGTRMNSSLPKVLHRVCGQPLIQHAINAVQQAGIDHPLLVLGYGADQIKAVLGQDIDYVLQSEQLGTGHAVMSARKSLQNGADIILVTSADMPLLTARTLRMLIDMQQKSSAALSMLTVIADDPRGFGRVIRAEDGKVLAIIEEAQASADQLAIKELNAGVYAFNADWLWNALPKIPLSAKGEYYLTDLVEIAVQQGQLVTALLCDDEIETMGINTRIHLAEAEKAMQARILDDLMLAGVTMIDPASTHIEASVKIGQDTIIQPNTYLRGQTVIGRNCEIGPNTIIADCQIGDNCRILAAVMEKAIVEDGVDMGPFVRLRKGAHLGARVHMGNFGEVKESYLGEGTKMGHFSYIGNAIIGKDVNIGAGTITCNYDGVHKHTTVIGDNVFLGSDTMLVAPVNLGENARTGAGAVVTHDVDAGEVVIGVPARPLRKKKDV